MPGTHTRGFASMDREKQRMIASKGGKAAHEKGTAHEFSSSEARKAGRKGGKASQAKRAQLKMTAQQSRATPPAQAAESQVMPSTPPVLQGAPEVTQAASEPMQKTVEQTSQMPAADIFTLLRTDHASVLRILRKMTDSGDNFSLQDELYPSLRREIDLHISAEERTVYPELLQRPETKDSTEEAARDHSDLREIISRLDSLCRSETNAAHRENWKVSLNELRETLEHHIALEESEIFDGMTRIFTQHELEDIAIQFIHAKESLQKMQERAA